MMKMEFRFHTVTKFWFSVTCLHKLQMFMFWIK